MFTFFSKQYNYGSDYITLELVKFSKKSENRVKLGKVPKEVKEAYNQWLEIEKASPEYQEELRINETRLIRDEMFEYAQTKGMNERNFLRFWKMGCYDFDESCFEIYRKNNLRLTNILHLDIITKKKLVEERFEQWLIVKGLDIYTDLY